MKETIKQNNYFNISVDVAKNRLYLKLYGTWDDVLIPQEYLKHNREGLNRLTPGFTSLVDLREMILPPEGTLQKILPYFVEGTKQGEEAGMRKQAQIVKLDIKEEKIKAREVIKDSDYDQKMIQFTDPVEAEKWLDM